MKTKTPKIRLFLAALFPFMLAGAIGHAQTDPVTVLNTGNFRAGDQLAPTNSFEVIADLNAKLVVVIGGEMGAGGINGPTSVTYGGVPLSNTFNGALRNLHVWYLDNPTAGTADLVVNLPVEQDPRIVAFSLGNAAAGDPSPTGTDSGNLTSLTATVTTTTDDTLLIASYTANDQSNPPETVPYTDVAGFGDSGSSYTTVGYIQVPTASGPTDYTWEQQPGDDPEISEVYVFGIPSAGALPSDPVSVLNTAEWYNSTAATVLTNSFEVLDALNRKLVVTIGTEDADTISSITYGGVDLELAASTGATRLAVVYYLDNPAAGIADLVVTWTGDVRCRIGAVCLGNAAEGFSVTAVSDILTVTQLDLDLTTTEANTLVVGAYTQNNQSTPITVEPYPVENRISYGDSGSSYTSTGYVQVAVPSGPTTYTWSKNFTESCGAVLVGFASAGQIQFGITDPVTVLNSEEWWAGNAVDQNPITNSFTVVGDPNSKLVVVVGGEGASATGITYGGVALTLAVAGDTRPVSIWYLDDPVAGAADLVVTLSGAQDPRIAALSLGNAADGVSIVSDPSLTPAVNVTQIDVELTTPEPDTLLVAAYTNNNVPINAFPYTVPDDQFATGGSGSSRTEAGYIQVPDALTPATYTWINDSAVSSEGIIAGFASAGVLPDLDGFEDFDVPTVASVPVLDGTINLGEWGDAFPVPMVWPELGSFPNVGGISSGTPPTDADDLSATLYYQWDATNLYFAIKVNDDVFIDALPGGTPFPDDHILFGFDPDINVDGPGSVILIDFALYDNGPGAFFRTDNPGGVVDQSYAAGIGAVTVSAATNANGYDIEISIPWSYLGITPTAGVTTFGTAVLLCDNDADDGSRDILLFSAGQGDSAVMVTPTKWHVATLDGGLQNTYDNFIAGADVGALFLRNDDGDGGGSSNEVEYFFGGLADDSSDDLTIQPYLESVAGGVLTYKYNRLIDHSALGISYDVIVLDNFDTPVDLATETETDATAISDKIEEVTVTVPLPAAPGKRFVTIEVTELP